MFRVTSLVVMTVSCLFAHPQNTEDGNDFTIITKRLLQNAMPVDSTLPHPDGEGKWSDINYNDTATNGWQPYKHWERVVEMARRHHLSSATQPGDTALASAIGKAVNFWYGKHPIARNWWWNVIGVPLKIGETLLLMGNNLSEI